MKILVLMSLVGLMQSAPVPTPPAAKKPPRYIQVVVRGTLTMLQGTDDKSVNSFVDALVVPGEPGDRARVVAELREIRRTVRPLLDNVVLEPADDGVVLVFSGKDIKRRVHIAVDRSGVHAVTLVELPRSPDAP